MSHWNFWVCDALYPPEMQSGRGGQLVVGPEGVGARVGPVGDDGVVGDGVGIGVGEVKQVRSPPALLQSLEQQC